MWKTEKIVSHRFLAEVSGVCLASSEFDSDSLVLEVDYCGLTLSSGQAKELAAKLLEWAEGPPKEESK